MSPNEDDIKISSELFKNAEVEPEVPPIAETADSEAIPLMEDETWHDYVMKQFGEEELIDGNPTVDGLRRVSRKLLGDVFYSKCHVIQSPNLQNNFCATVEHEIGIRWKRELYAGQIEDRWFAEVADVNEQNCEAEYRRFASSTASTRAEARALRKALMLKRVVAAEEITTIAPVSDDPDQQGKIQTTQVNFLVNLARRNNIHLMKFINMGKTKYKTVNDIPYATAIKMIGAMSGFQQKPDKRPESIIGWTDTWAKYWDKAWDNTNEVQSSSKE